MPAVPNLLILLLVSFTVANCLDVSTTVIPVSGNGVNSFSAGGGFGVDVHIGFQIDFSWFFTALQAFLDGFFVLTKMLIELMVGGFKTAIDLFLGSINAAIALLQNVFVYSIEELYELIVNFFAQISVAIKYGNMLADQLFKGFAFIAAGELKLVISLLEVLVNLINVFLSKPPVSSVNFTIAFETRLGAEFQSSLNETFRDVTGLKNALNSVSNAENNASIVALQASIYSAIVVVDNVTVNNATELLKLLFTFSDRLGDIYIKSNILYNLLQNESHSVEATKLKVFSGKITALYDLSLKFIKSQIDDSIPQDHLNFTIAFVDNLTANITISLELIYNLTETAQQIATWIAKDERYAEDVNNFVTSIDAFIGDISGITVNNKMELTVLLVKLEEDSVEVLKYGNVLSTDFSTYGTYSLVGGLKYYLSLFYKLQDQITEYTGRSSSVTPSGPNGPNPAGLTILFPFAFDGEILIVVNGAYEIYVAWKAAVLVVVDVTLRSSIVSLEASIDAAFNVLFEEPITSLAVLVELVAEFLARISVVIQIGSELMAQIASTGLASVVGAFNIFFAFLGGLYASITKIIPEVKTATTPFIDTTTRATTQVPRSDLNFTVQLNNTLDQQLSTTFIAVYRLYLKFEVDLKSSSGIQNFADDTQTFLASVDVVFQYLQDVTVVTADQMQSLLVKLGGELKTAIANGQKLYQDLWGAGSVDIAVQIKLFLGYFSIALADINSINNNIGECSILICL